MNYIAEIRAFYDWIPFNSTPADAQALWHVLMNLNNKCAVCVNGEWLWRVEFTVSNSTLLSALGFSRTQLDRMRNVLIQSGRIRYRKGKGNQSGTYQMVPFDTHYVTQSVTQPGTQPGTQTVTQMWRNRGPLNNYNNTSNCNSNFSLVGDDGTGADASVGEEAKDLVGLYLDNRDLAMDAYFGMSAKVRAAAEELARGIFSKFTTRKPTQQDVVLVFHCTRESRELPSGAWEITLHKDRVALLLYAFEAATSSGNPGDWRYVNGVLRRLAQRKITTLEGAEEYDDKKAEMR